MAGTSYARRKLAELIGEEFDNDPRLKRTNKLAGIAKMVFT